MKKFFICLDPEMGLVEVDKTDYSKTKIRNGHYVKETDAELALSLIKDIAEASRDSVSDADLVECWQNAARCVLEELSK